jgi:two-component system sensor histidine kinase ChvG
MKLPETPQRPQWRRALTSIGARLLVVNALLVVVPLAGISFARTYERELLRAEEEGMVALATTLAGTLALRPSEDAEAVKAGAVAAAERLGVQVRLLDANGRSLFDTGPEEVDLRTAGRQLLSATFDPRGIRRVRVQESLPADGDLRVRPEVSAALAGRPGRYTRRMENLRGARLFIAEPVRPLAGAVAVVYVARTTYPALVSLYRIRNGLIKVGAGSILVAAIVSLFLAFTISRPLRRLTNAAGRIAAGERGVALNLKGHDEIAELSRDFDAMARALDARLGYISELAANVSHEFKTPIASIRGATELLRDGAADDPEARGVFLENMLGDTERLSRLVTRLLELSRVEASPEARVPVDYRALVEAVVARYRDGDKPVSLVWSASHDHCLAARDSLESALSNLIDNALRFSPAETVVMVRVEGDAHGFHTAVRDEGIGISENNLARVWDRFFTTARADGGTGLGLAIVRVVIEAHGGTVGVTSKPGAGSTFWYTLPRRL